MPIQFDDTTNDTPEYAAFVEKFKPKKKRPTTATRQTMYTRQCRLGR